MNWIIGKIIEASVRNRFIVFLLVGVLILIGYYCVQRTPVDAIPDLSENQVIVWADWMGRSPKEVEDQITYPLSVNLQGLAGVKSIRATSEFGFSMINIIFEDSIDFYFARQRVLERLSIAGGFLPGGVVPYLAPDATALGQIFWYTVEGEGKSLDELRSIQDWYVRYQLNSVPGVVEVGSVGGFVREYQIDVTPEKLRAFDISLGDVFRSVMASNSSVGGKVIHKGGSEYLVRGTGWLKGIEDIRDIVVTERKGVPITVDQLGTVQMGPAFRRSVLEKDGREAVGAVVMMRYGENPLEVTRHIKEKIQDLQAGLPPGVRIVPFYDRTGLIDASIHTLTHTLLEEIIIASIVIFLVLMHFRSAFVICVTLPIAVLIAFIFMYLFKIPSNIMSLSGIAISIGVLVDSAIVMTENAYHRLHDHFKDGKVTGDTRELVIEACKVVGGPLFFSVVIMLLSFAPIFTLGGMEGKMFNPLAYTKTFALLGVALLGITFVPALLPTFIRGKLKAQEDVWLVRSVQNIYKPMLEFFLKHPDWIVVLTGAFMFVSLPFFPRASGFVPKMPWFFFVVGAPFLVGASASMVARRKFVTLGILLLVAIASYTFLRPLGEEFMPPLNELAIMDMPTTTPNVNITQAGDDLKERDQILKQFPEVHQVVGKSGRAETPTDPAPIDMVETVVSLRPEAWWPKRTLHFDDALKESEQVVRALIARGILKPIPEAEIHEFANTVAMDATTKFDRSMRELSLRRLKEYIPQKGDELVRHITNAFLTFLRSKDNSSRALGGSKAVLKREPTELELAPLRERLTQRYARSFDEWILPSDVTKAVQELIDELAKKDMLEPSSDLMVDPESALQKILDPIRAVAGKERPNFFQRLHESLEEKHDELMKARVKQLNWELEDRAPETAVWFLIEEALVKGRERRDVVKEPAAGELEAVRDERAKIFGKNLFLWKKKQEEVRMEMDSDLQVPGWGNIWTRPIQNRVDMLATGVRTMVGVKVFAQTPEEIQKVSDDVAKVLKTIRGAVDVFPDQTVGENYLEITIDRKKAARYGVTVQDMQDVIEVALGGKEITMTVEGRQRFPVRVRYPRDFREDEERVRNILVPMGGGGSMASSASDATAMGGGGGAKEMKGSISPTTPGARLGQIPLSQVADIKIVPGPSMIKSENGQLRSYVQLNVRDRDIVGFVEEAKQAVASQVKLPPRSSVEWSGQFEHQVRAQKTLTIVFPMVILIIFVILFMTYKDMADTVMMFLAVPGAIAGGAIFQWIFGFNFSVAVWVGYVACFGLATQTGVIMMVYLREAIDKRGGLANFKNEEEIRLAVIEGAVHRLRPKLLTEATMVLALIPMLWANGVGSEFMKPMAAPILGGILVADEVIDILIPVLFYWERCRRFRKLKAGGGDGSGPEDQVPMIVPVTES
jgi:Cu(I)/Ag(I) efflux system membrane protein CusA/SilA